MNRQSKTLGDCLDLTNLASYITVPTFFIQSPYDPTLALYLFQGGITCSVAYASEALDDCSSTQRKYLEDLRIRVLNDLYTTSKISSSIGVWVPACATHVYLPYSFFTDQYALLTDAP